MNTQDLTARIVEVVAAIEASAATVEQADAAHAEWTELQQRNCSHFGDPARAKRLVAGAAMQLYLDRRELVSLQRLLGTQINSAARRLSSEKARRRCCFINGALSDAPAASVLICAA